MKYGTRGQRGRPVWLGGCEGGVRRFFVGHSTCRVSRPQTTGVRLPVLFASSTSPSISGEYRPSAGILVVPWMPFTVACPNLRAAANITVVLI